MGETKLLLIQTVSESKLLFPSVLTLFMPSMFTQYGCIYANSVVPSANSIKCEHEIRFKNEEKSDSNHNHDKLVIRWLKFWVIRSFILIFLQYMSNILNWIPFSTHFTLILWLWLNLPYDNFGGANTIYRFFEYELMGFGLLPRRNQQDDSKDEDDQLNNNNFKNILFTDTLTVRFVQKLLKTLPSSKKLTEEMGNDATLSVENKNGNQLDNTPNKAMIKDSTATPNESKQVSEEDLDDKENKSSSSNTNLTDTSKLQHKENEAENEIEEQTETNTEEDPKSVTVSQQLDDESKVEAPYDALSNKEKLARAKRKGDALAEELKEKRLNKITSPKPMKKTSGVNTTPGVRTRARRKRESLEGTITDDN